MSPISAISPVSRSSMFNWVSAETLRIHLIAITAIMAIVALRPLWRLWPLRPLCPLCPLCPLRPWCPLCPLCPLQTAYTCPCSKMSLRETNTTHRIHFVVCPHYEVSSTLNFLFSSWLDGTRLFTYGETISHIFKSNLVAIRIFCLLPL